MEKRALLVGVNHYNNFSSLNGCVDDVKAMEELLNRNEDGSVNYVCKSLLSVDATNSEVTRGNLRRECRDLFAYDGDVIFYFSGHGILTGTGGFLATTDAETDDYGLSMQEILQMANSSRAKNVLIILDTCHSGAMGNRPEYSVTNILDGLRENITIIAASKDSEESVEAGGHGLFTTALIDALDGGAADHMGWVTPPSIYAYAERRFDALAQRPVYKSHATHMSVIRMCAPLIDRLLLRELPLHFSTQESKFQLDPEYEPEDENGNVHEPVNKAKVDIAQLFKSYRDTGLLKPTIVNEQLYWTARRSHTVELTLLGKEYWRLVKNGRI
jgi:hypothetical protein